MSGRAQRRLPWIWTGVVAVVSLVLVLVGGYSVDGVVSVADVALRLVLPIVFTALGAVIATRQPGNRIAWIMFVVGVGVILDGVAQPLIHTKPVAPIAGLLPAQSAIAVATSTLAVAALFNPLRRRVQRIVDRRFNRSAHQAERVSEVFGTKMRKALTVEELSDLWSRTTVAVFQPSNAAIWVSAET